MRNDNKRSPLAPLKIDYIVLNNLDKVRSLVERSGYQAPKDEMELLRGVKYLIRLKGRMFVKELLKLHPDRNAIKALEEELEDSYCSACSNYSYDPVTNCCGGCGHSNYNGDLKRLDGMSQGELEQYYKQILEKTKRNPKDKSLSKELEFVWNALRKIRAPESKDPGEAKQNFFQQYRLQLLLALTLITGMIIGLPKLNLFKNAA